MTTDEDEFFDAPKKRRRTHNANTDKRFTVKGGHGNYVVSHINGGPGEWQCSCRGWISHRSTCKHIELVQNLLGELELIPAEKRDVRIDFYVVGEDAQRSDAVFTRENERAWTLDENAFSRVEMLTGVKRDEWALHSHWCSSGSSTTLVDAYYLVGKNVRLMVRWSERDAG